MGKVISIANPDGVKPFLRVSRGVIGEDTFFFPRESPDEFGHAGKKPSPGNITSLSHLCKTFRGVGVVNCGLKVVWTIITWYSGNDPEAILGSRGYNTAAG